MTSVSLTLVLGLSSLTDHEVSAWEYVTVIIGMTLVVVGLALALRAYRREVKRK
ncbi:hypothetical protein ACIRO1_33620 [Streptomyces sp. NPDC102381]|uniref:hypothetical protein n=1 Tax=Streptomyces sp. NPDC102381 TaxID=3366164 RepID=UPI003813BFF1